MRKSCPLASCVIWKRLSRTGWLNPLQKAACFTVWLLGLRRYQFSIRSSDQLEKLQVKVAFDPSDTVSQAGEKVSGLQDPLETSEMEENKHLSGQGVCTLSEIPGERNGSLRPTQGQSLLRSFPAKEPVACCRLWVCNPQPQETGLVL